MNFRPGERRNKRENNFLRNLESWTAVQKIISLKTQYTRCLRWCLFGTNDVRPCTVQNQRNNEVIFICWVLKFNLFYEYSFELIEKETERVERVNAKSKH